MSTSSDAGRAAIERAVELAHFADRSRRLGRLEDAVDAFRKAVALAPKLPALHYNLGATLELLGRWDGAVAGYRTAAALDPQLVAAHFNLGNVLTRLGRFDEAISSYRTAVAIEPGLAEGHNNLGNALKGMGRLDDAAASFRRAIAVRPGFADGYNNLGNALEALGQLNEAVACYRQGLAIKPDLADCHNNLGNVLKRLHRFDEAIASYDAAIALNPDDAEAHNNQGLGFLLMGRLEQGWRQYEWRKKLKNKTVAQSYRQPLWLGEENIAGKTLFIHWEQGYGDTLQFCRYALVAQARGATVILSVQDRLRHLMTNLSPTIQVIGAKEIPSAFDYHCPLLSMPLAFKTDLGSIPAPIPYVHSDDGRVRTWRKRLGKKTKPRVGLVWSGGTLHTNDHNRSLTLAQFLPLLADGAEYISLQKDLRAVDADRLASRPDIRHFGDQQNDFSDAAALVASMDLVVTVCTSVAHLAGAMGKPVWILLPHLPDWRWFLDRNDSPWYPSARLFRQQKIGDWGGVVDRVAKELRGFITST